jgi:hypothetical protein
MLELTLFNFALLLVIAAGLVIVKRTVKNEKAQNIILLASAVVTILCHYSSLLYHHLTAGDAFTYLKHNPNLILPIYPCNVVMWSCLIYGIMKNKDSKTSKLLSDYIFWFGIFSTLVGMFANVDFIRNPTLADFDITKGIVAHATLLFNVLLIPLFGKIKLDFVRNMKNMLISVVGMYAIGLYCNLVFEALVSSDMAYQVNSMFIIHSPFDGVDFLTYPTIAGLALMLYFITFTICEIVSHKKGERWFDKASEWIKEKLVKKS